MKKLMQRVRKLAVPLVVVPTISVGAAIGVIAASGAAPAGATATTCQATTSTSCSDTGTLTLSAGTLTATMPSSLSWSGTLSGTNSNLVDTTAADQSFQVDDNTGSGAGWHVTASATQFTSTSGTSTYTLPSSAFSVNGSLSSATATTAPSETCVSTCTLPTDSTTYPVGISTAAVDIYDTQAGTGLGDVTIGGSSSSAPVGWWLAIPATTRAGTYTSTIVFSIVSGP